MCKIKTGKEEKEELKEAKVKEIEGNCIHKTLGKGHTNWNEIQTSDKVIAA